MPRKKKTKRAVRKKVQKKHSWRNLIFALGWFGCGVLFITFLSTASINHESRACSEFFVHINDRAMQGFISEEDVQEILHSALPKDSVGAPMLRDISLTDLEKHLESHPYIDLAESHLDTRGRLFLEVKPHIPIARIIMSNGESGYINKEGQLMPVSKVYTSRVMVFSGEIDLANRSENSQFAQIANMASAIHENEFLKAMIEQISVDAKGNLELACKLGNQEIVFGEPKDINDKLHRLELFFREGFALGKYQHCKSINLNYNNQIICSK